MKEYIIKTVRMIDDLQKQMDEVDSLIESRLDENPEADVDNMVSASDALYENKYNLAQQLAERLVKFSIGMLNYEDAMRVIWHKRAELLELAERIA